MCVCLYLINLKHEECASLMHVFEYPCFLVYNEFSEVMIDSPEYDCQSHETFEKYALKERSDNKCKRTNEM